MSQSFISSNLEADLIGVYKGLFSIFDGVDVVNDDRIDYDHPITIEVLDQADSEKFYSAAGLKRKKSLGDSSTWRAVMKKSSDLFDTVNPPTDIKTISYWRKRIVTDRIIPTILFQLLDEADSAANKFIVMQATGTLEVIKDVPREEGLAAQEIELGGEILTYPKPGLRQAAAPVPTP